MVYFFSHGSLILYGVVALYSQKPILLFVQLYCTNYLVSLDVNQ